MQSQPEIPQHLKSAKETDLARLQPIRDAMTLEEQASFKYQIARAKYTMSAQEKALLAKALPELDLTNLTRPGKNRKLNDNGKTVDSTYSEIMSQISQLILERKLQNTGAKRFEAAYLFLEYYQRGNDFRNPEDHLNSGYHKNKQDQTKLVREKLQQTVAKLSMFKAGTSELKELLKIVEQKAQLAKKIKRQHTPLLTSSSDGDTAFNARRAEKTHTAITPISDNRVAPIAQFFPPRKLETHSDRIQAIVKDYSAAHPLLTDNEQVILNLFINNYQAMTTATTLPPDFDPDSGTGLNEIGNQVIVAKKIYKELKKNANELNGYFKAGLQTDLIGSEEDPAIQKITLFTKNLQLIINDSKMTLEAIIHLADHTTSSIKAKNS
jgi:hypothetical protein